MQNPSTYSWATLCQTTFNLDHNWRSYGGGIVSSSFPLPATPLGPPILRQIPCPFAQSSFTICRWILHYRWAGTRTVCELVQVTTFESWAVTHHRCTLQLCRKDLPDGIQHVSKCQVEIIYLTQNTSSAKQCWVYSKPLYLIYNSLNIREKASKWKSILLTTFHI